MWLKNYKIFIIQRTGVGSKLYTVIVDKLHFLTGGGGALEDNITSVHWNYGLDTPTSYITRISALQCCLEGP